MSHALLLLTIQYYKITIIHCNRTFLQGLMLCTQKEMHSIL